MSTYPAAFGAFTLIPAARTKTAQFWKWVGEKGNLQKSFSNLTSNMHSTHKKRLIVPSVWQYKSSMGAYHFNSGSKSYFLINMPNLKTSLEQKMQKNIPIQQHFETIELKQLVFKKCFTKNDADPPWIIYTYPAVIRVFTSIPAVGPIHLPTNTDTNTDTDTYTNTVTNMNDWRKESILILILIQIQILIPILILTRSKPDYVEFVLL